MGFTMIDLDAPMTQTDFALLVGVSKQAVGGQIRKGTLNRDHTGRQWLHAYCDHLRTVSAGRSGGDQSSLTNARIEESIEKTLSLRQKRLADAGALLVLDDVENALLEIPSLFQSSVISAGHAIKDAIESKHGIKLDDDIISSPIADALRLVANHIDEFGRSLREDGAEPPA